MGKLNDKITKKLQKFVEDAGGEIEWTVFVDKCLEQGMQKKVDFAEVLNAARNGELPFVWDNRKNDPVLKMWGNRK